FVILHGQRTPALAVVFSTSYTKRATTSTRQKHARCHHHWHHGGRAMPSALERVGKHQNPFSWRNAVDDLHHECAVQGPREGSCRGEAVRRCAVSGVPGVPDQE